MANKLSKALDNKRTLNFISVIAIVVLVILAVLFVVVSLGSKGNYERTLQFTNSGDFTYDITKVDITSKGMTLLNKGDKSNTIQLNPLKLSTEEGSSEEILEFSQDADVPGASMITYEISADEKTWMFYNGEKWAQVGMCDKCYNTAEEINKHIGDLELAGNHLRFKVHMASDNDNVPVLRSINLKIKGKDDGKSVNGLSSSLALASSVTPGSAVVSCPQDVVNAVIESGSLKKNVIAWNFTFADGWYGTGVSLVNTATIHDMTVHVSCSANYDQDGYPDKDEPIESLGQPAVRNYSIAKYSVELNSNHQSIKCDITNTCSETFGPYCSDGNVDQGEQCDDGNRTDGDGCSATCQNENQPPVAVDDTRETPFNTPVEITVLSNDYDTDGVLVPNTIQVVSNPSYGTITNINTTNGNITYTPNNGFVGVDHFDYKICDNDGLCDTATVTITVKPKPLIPPVATDDSRTTPENTPVTIDILDNDYDSDGNLVPSTVSITNNPSNGTITNINTTTGQVEYSPNAGFYGVDHFEYKVCDNDGLCDTAIVTITITEIQKFPPVAVNDTETTQVGVPVTTNILVNDSDSDGVIVPNTVTIITNPSFGTITNINLTNGNVEYTPNPGYVGVDNYVYQVCDNDGLCDTAIVTITINQEPIELIPPVAVDDFKITQVNTPVDVPLLANDSDADGVLVPSTTTIIIQPTNGTITNVNGTNGVVTYTPNTNFTGTDTFVYSICDNDGLCDTATAVIEINPIALIPPVAINDSRTTLVNTPIDITVLENDFDVDGVLVPSTVVVITNPTNGTITSINTSNGVMTYQPNTGFTGTDSYVYQVCDNDGLCATATVTIIISTTVLVPPIAIDDPTETPFNTPVTIDLPDNDSDPDGTIVTSCMSVLSGPTNGTVTIDTTTGIATYTPNTGFTGLDSFVYQICDNDNLFDTATALINVLPTVTPPVIPPTVFPTPPVVVTSPDIISFDGGVCGVTSTSGTNTYNGSINGDYPVGTILEYTLSNGLSWRPIANVTGLGTGTGTATFSFTLDDYPSGDYNVVVRAIPLTGDVVGTVDCPFVVDLGDLIFGANEFVLDEQHGPMVANGLIQFRKDEPQRLWMEARGATKFDIVNLDQLNQVFPLSYDEDLKLWTGELVFGETGLFRLEGQVSNSIGGFYSREINSVFVTDGRDITDYKTGELVDATVTVYEKDVLTGNFQLWNGSAYGQSNPYTVTDGQLSVILPQGEFYLEISHPDYNTITSLITSVSDQSLVRANVKMLQTGILARLTSLVDSEDVSNNFPLDVTPLPDFNLLEVGAVVPPILGVGEETATYSLLDVLDQNKYTVLMMYSDWNTESQEQLEIYSDLVNNYVDTIGNVQFAEISTMPPPEIELTYLERGEYNDVVHFEPNDQFYDDYMIISLPHFIVLNPAREYLGQVVGSYPASDLAERLADIVASDQ